MLSLDLSGLCFSIVKGRHWEVEAWALSLTY